MTEGTREQNRLVGTMSPGVSTPATTLRGRWLVLGRVAWVAVAILTAIAYFCGLVLFTTMQPAHVSLWLRPETVSKGEQRR